MTIAEFRRHTLRGRFAPLVLLVAVYLAIAFGTRAALFLHSLRELDAPVRAFPAVFSIGALYDLVAASYLFGPLALYLFLVPQRLYRSRAHRALMLGASFCTTFGLLYLAVVEFFFFEEFDARFNFVAVDYLVYPHEVFVNIWESYPVGRVLLASLAVTLVLSSRPSRLLRASFEVPSRYRDRLPPLALFASLLLLGYVGVDATTGRCFANRVANELAQNGVYSFFHAALTNDLDYDQYYPTLDAAEAGRRARALVSQPNASFVPGASSPLARHIDNPGEPRRLNVVLLVEESLGADFVGAYGDARGLTPNIDALAGQSLVFTDVYATGTRTVRGLEAISASFPPIPGESIVKRPSSERIFTWAEVMRRNGYSPTFIYGGYGTFDNMNRYFGRNGFVVQDRTDMERPSFANIWGVCDEDLFRHAITVFDRQYARGEKIFSLIMTTSNHKPFTFPEGIPGIQPAGGGREMGVKYADYALGRFLDRIRTKPYFADTLFVLVGDHGARVYGKADIPLRSYELPLLMYAPKHVPPGKVDALASQIDIMPTVLGLLHLSYDSVAFGHDILSGDPGGRFVLMSHDRDVAMYRHGNLTVLGLKKTTATYRYDRATDRQERTASDEEEVKDAISLYQEGADLFSHGRYRLN